MFWGTSWSVSSGLVSRLQMVFCPHGDMKGKPANDTATFEKVLTVARKREKKPSPHNTSGLSKDKRECYRKKKILGGSRVYGVNMARYKRRVKKKSSPRKSRKNRAFAWRLSARGLCLWARRLLFKADAANSVCKCVWKLAGAAAAVTRRETAPVNPSVLCLSILNAKECSRLSAKQSGL